jgi:hypothetical protein
MYKKRIRRYVVHKCRLCKAEVGGFSKKLESDKRGFRVKNAYNETRIFCGYCMANRLTLW